MEIRESGESLAKALGDRLRAVRRQAGMTQEAVGAALGLSDSTRHVYVGKLERGKLPGVSFRTLVRYLKACNMPIGRFMLEMAQSGAFGEAEQGLVVVDDSSSSSLKLRDEKRAKAKLLYQKRWERESQDAAIVARLWSEVMPAVQRLLPQDPSRRLMAPYLEGVRAMYRAWKQAVRGAANRDPTSDVQMAFDRIEQAGLERLVPTAVHKMREIVFDRLMRMTPLGGNT
jgi:transcriptional regulator with XRE-family HTH domain